MISTDSLVKGLRKFRSLHKYIGISASAFFLITVTTGLLLGWKKNSETLQPPTKSGLSSDMQRWQSFETISAAAIRGMDSTGNAGNEIDRMDVRPDKGLVKVLFKNGYWEVQVDASNAKVLSVAQRHSDWIEHIHDGSIVSEFFKLGYTTLLGLSLLVMTMTGCWIWYGPKVIRKSKGI
jgi:uncharacterized iron-regulated membrane protein